MEPQISGAKAQKVCDSLGFPNIFRVKAVYLSGGIWLLWNSNYTSLQIVEVNANFIHAKICFSEDSFFHPIIVYGPPSVARHFELLIVVGNFNYIVSLDERASGSGGLMNDSSTFIDVIDLCNLIDMGFSGLHFMWRHGSPESTSFLKLLDRVLANTAARNQ
ncbi:hypothetical protein V2J09_004151 [Rumex salicifolius]